MITTYVFDTFGTMVHQGVAEDLNNLFFDKGERLGHTPEQLGLLYAQFNENPIHPEFLRASSPGKKKILQDGLYQVKFFPDVKPTFEKIREQGAGITIFSKGEVEVITELYCQGDLLALVGEENIVSSANFRVQNKRDHRCYFELAERLAVRQQIFHSYTSDDPLEVMAFKKAFSSKPAYLIDRERMILESKIPVIHSLEEVVR